MSEPFLCFRCNTDGPPLYCLKCANEALAKRIEELEREGAHKFNLRLFPIQDGEYIPWHLAKKAYRFYVERFGNSQSLERLAERGGFGWTEFLHLYYEDKSFAHPQEMKDRWAKDELASALHQLEQSQAANRVLEANCKTLTGLLENSQESNRVLVANEAKLREELNG